MEPVESTPASREPWNKGKLVGQKTHTHVAAYLHDSTHGL